MSDPVFDEIDRLKARIETLEAALKAAHLHITAMEQDREILEARIALTPEQNK